MTDFYPGAAEPPVGSIVRSTLDKWEWQRVPSATGFTWEPVHMLGRPAVGQGWNRILEFGPLELLRWGPNY